MSPRGAWQVLASWTFTLVWVAVVISASVVTLGFAKPLTARLLRVWGRTMLRIARIRLVVENPEAIEAREPRVVTFNHGSIQDAMLVTAVFTPHSTAAIKRDVLYYPGVGIALVLVGFLLVDRARPGNARAMLDKAAARLVREKLTVFIAPEGTRTKDGDLQKFKRGAYILAIDAGVPVVPMCIDNVIELHPYGTYVSKPGTVRIRFGEPRPTTGFTHDDADRETLALHDWYADALAKMKAERPAA